MEKHLVQRKKYKKIEKQLQETGESQISTSDPDSRQMITRNNITEVAYNIQTTVDSKYNIPIDYKLTNENDSKAMGLMLRRCKSILKNDSFTVLYDKGYHTGSEFKVAADLGLNVMVAIPKVAAQAPKAEYNVENFTFIESTDCYICPQGQTLKTTGKLHQGKTYSFKRYTTKACLACEEKQNCSKAKYGKAIQRSEYQELIELNKKKTVSHKEQYKRRQAIVEHPYGTIKRQWGFDYIMTKKSIKRASADVGLIFTAYNLRRILNIIEINRLIPILNSILQHFFLKISQIKPIFAIQCNFSRSIRNKIGYSLKLEMRKIDLMNLVGF